MRKRKAFTSRTHEFIRSALSCYNVKPHSAAAATAEQLSCRNCLNQVLCTTQEHIQNSSFFGAFSVQRLHVLGSSHLFHPKDYSFPKKNALTPLPLRSFLASRKPPSRFLSRSQERWDWSEISG